MLNPNDRTTGRGLLLFAALMLGLGLFAGAVRGAWRDAGLWLALAVFMACYGALLLDRLPQLRRLLLAVGLVAGALAFGLALLQLGGP
jgi:hypothetical protein